MREITDLKEIQMLEIGILKDVSDYCEKNNLRYFLAGGSLLGAVRHKGFIPWDDDIDISMPRPDYEYFISNYSTDKPYILIGIHNCKNYAYPFVKVIDTRTKVLEDDQPFVDCENLGIYIDIFPIDGVCNSREMAIKNVIRYSRRGHFLGFALLARRNASLIQKAKRLFWVIRFSIPGREWYYRRLTKALMKNDFDSSDYVVSSFGARFTKEIIRREAFSGYLLMKFNEDEFRCPIGYDEYLQQMYGDYMRLPSKEQRNRKHNMRAFWK